MSKGYIKSLDGVRALAMILIMTYHSDIMHFTWVSLQLFFVLSGFLITGILWNEKHRPESTGFKFKKFYVRRTLRIFPLYFGYLAALGILYLLVHFPPILPRLFPNLVTYTFNYTRAVLDWKFSPLFTHLWSLSAEEQFYLFFPTIIFLCPPKFIKGFMLACIVASPVVRLFLGIHYVHAGFAPHDAGDALYWNTLSHLDAFFLGGCIPVFSLDQRVRRPHRLFLAVSLVVLAAGFVNWLTAEPGISYFHDLGYNHTSLVNYANVWHYTCADAFFASFILGLVSVHRFRGFEFARRLLEVNWLVRVGKVSYAMYIFHFAVLVYGFERYWPHATQLWARLLFFVPYVLVVYGLAELSYTFFESRFLKLKDVLFPNLEKSSARAKTAPVPVAATKSEA